MNKWIFVAALAVALLGAACKRPQARHYVVLIDLSGSINSSGQLLEAVNAVVNGARRGDAVTLLPILSDESDEIQGHAKTFILRRERESWDSDLVQLHSRVREYLQRIQLQMNQHPGRETDLIGAVHVADEIALEDARRVPYLILLTDGLQDARGLRFVTSPNLRDSKEATQLARKICGRQPPIPARSPAVLALMASKDTAALSDARRRAVIKFWTVYLDQQGWVLRTYTDGPDALAAHAIDDQRQSGA